MTRADKITLGKIRKRKLLNARERARGKLLGRWMAYSDELKYRATLDMDHFYHVIFVMPMAKSWSRNKRAEHVFQRHQQVPDKDNLEKGLLDALFGQDCAAWDGRVTKVWGVAPFIIISPDNLPVDPDSIASLLACGATSG